MNKFQSLTILERNGDSIVTIKGEGAIGATTDFNNKYIKSKRFTKLPRDKQSILVWDWTNDKFRVIDVTNIKTIKPLSELLGNIRDGEEKQSW